tara:strand:+ start:572 stop:1831 length:1260 start_codon:yes stop_codon:yes gene_type:complete
MKNLLPLILTFCAFQTYALNVNIPDADFKSYLVGHTLINTNNDSEIQVSEAESYTGSIGIIYDGISDLTGIEAFTELTSLTCSHNNINALDVSANTKLTSLSCDDNNISTLDITNNTELTHLVCGKNNLTTLDLSQNTKLTYISIDENSIATIDFSQNLEMTNLTCDENSLTSLDLSKNTKITNLNAGDNPVGTLDLTKNTALKFVTIPDMGLSSIDLSQNTAMIHFLAYRNVLTSLDVQYNLALSKITIWQNNLTELDVSMLPNLSSLSVATNSLTSLNLKNGNNTKMQYTHSFNASSNPNLTCIQVDDTSYSNNAWPNLDSTASFMEDCSMITGVADNNYYQEVKIFPNPSNGAFSINANGGINLIQVYDISGKLVESIKPNKTNSLINFTIDQPGIYITQVTSKSVTETLRIVVSK